MAKDQMTNGKAKWLICPAAQKRESFENSWGGDESDNQFAPISDDGGLPLFAKSFYAANVKSASVDASALGIFDLWINGRRVTNGGIADEMKPGWTDYRKHAMFYSYDITDYLVNGENTVLAVTAPGWYGGRISFGSYPDCDISFIAALHIDDDNGKNDIYTDESWQTAKGGIIRFSEIWDGEYIDFNFDDYSKISLPEYDKSAWINAKTKPHDIDITPQVGPAVRIRSGLDRKSQSIVIFEGTKDNGSDFGEINTVAEFDDTDSITLKKGQTAVVDFGQNMVGWPSIKLCGAMGTEIMIRFGEMLNDSGEKSRGNDNPKGSIYSINYRSAKSKLQYVLSGAGFESCWPIATFFGFRYIQITASDDVKLNDITGLVVGSDTHETGHIETSHAKVNRLISNILWGQRGNYLSIPTDCPQRNERLGWTGDTQMFCQTAAYNADVDGFFRKWLRDARDSQNDDGRFTDVIPDVNIVSSGSAAWADAGIIVPYIMLKMYNDTELVREHYAAMEKYMAWLESRGMEGPNPTYGDWLDWTLPEQTDKEYISLLYFAHDARLMAAMSKAIGKSDREAHYDELYNEIKAHFNAVYCDENGDINPAYRTQTGYLLALMTDMLNNERRAKAVSALKAKIIANGCRLSTGFVGSGLINEVLSENGECNLAYSLLLQTENPSWLYSVDQGATTIWERWNSYTIADGFGDVAMNSFNHYAYGAVGEWLYRHVAGIEADNEAYGFERVILQPTPDTRKDSEMPSGQEHITWVKCSYESKTGEFISNWSTENGGFEYKAKTPVYAKLLLPIVTGGDTFTINGVTHRFDEFECENGRIIIRLAPGEYEIIEPHN